MFRRQEIDEAAFEKLGRAEARFFRGDIEEDAEPFSADLSTLLLQRRHTRSPFPRHSRGSSLRAERVRLG